MAPNRPSSPAGGPSKNRKQATVAQVHDVSKTIRGQTKKDKAAAQSKAEMGDRAGMSKDVVKAVMASPLTVAWPNIPRHLQTATLHALKELIPTEVADYHVSRARCHQIDKRVRRRQLRKTVKDETRAMHGAEASAVKSEAVEDDMPMSVDQAVVGDKRKSADLNLDSSGQPAAKKTRTAVTTSNDGPSQADTERPTKPAVLSDLVLGINEVIKSLETQIDQLKFQLMTMGDALSGRPPHTVKPSSIKGKGTDTIYLLPTAPRSPSPEPESGLPSDTKPSPVVSAQPSKEQPTVSLPLEFVVVPLLSVNPPSLVSPIPQYCATYNALIYQYQQLARICRTRIKSFDVDDVIGPEREECRVVPLGAVELEMAQLVGLRRLACLGVKSSHPNIEIIRKLLPKSILHSPRHALTLPIPTSSLLSIHTSANSTKAKAKPNSKSNSKQSDGPYTTTATTQTVSPLPIPDVHYANLHIKGIQTKMPVDNAARKAKRLEEVRRKRVEAKLRKKEGKRRREA
ncbi:hypothetical protein IAU59_001156 [Kwoniella sp. CBS 9459]